MAESINAVAIHIGHRSVRAPTDIAANQFHVNRRTRFDFAWSSWSKARRTSTASSLDRSKTECVKELAKLLKRSGRCTGDEQRCFDAAQRRRTRTGGKRTGTQKRLRQQKLRERCALREFLILLIDERRRRFGGQNAALSGPYRSAVGNALGRRGILLVKQPKHLLNRVDSRNGLGSNVGSECDCTKKVPVD